MKYDWLVYYVDPTREDFKGMDGPSPEDWGHSWSSDDSPSVMLSLYGPEHKPDVQIISGEGSGEIEMLDAANLLNDEEVATLYEKALQDPKIFAAMEAAAACLKEQNVPYAFLGTGEIAVHYCPGEGWQQD
jgi:hypothetical protein